MKILKQEGDITKKFALIAILAVIAYALGQEIGIGILALFLMLNAS